MAPIRRLLIAGLAVVITGFLTGCSGNNQQDSELPTSTSVTLQTVTTGLNFPVFMTAPRGAAPAGDPTRLFIVEKGGLIKIFDLTTNSLRAAPFLNISNLLLTTRGEEEGLLGLAFHPQYAVNGQFYVFYTNVDSNIVIARYLRNATDPNLAVPSSSTILLTVDHPTNSNHNGGMLAFGPDGCLYTGVGDGGGGGDPNNNGQTVTTRLGKLLRINPDTGGPCNNNIVNPFLLLGGQAQFVWSLGLRNPWRFSFDRQIGDLYIGDVGQNAREEIDVVVGSNAGRQVNFGWRVMEGFLCFNPSSNCDTSGLTLPVLDYPHLDGACSVTGGYVYRGSVNPSLQGTYFYGDFCAGFVRSFRYQNGQPIEQTEWPLLSPQGGSITSFGEDALGELYLMTREGGLFKFVPN